MPTFTLRYENTDLTDREIDQLKHEFNEVTKNKAFLSALQFSLKSPQVIKDLRYENRQLKKNLASVIKNIAEQKRLKEELESLFSDSSNFI